jgi:hypothetical protein
VWAAPTGRDAAAGLGHRPAAHAGAWPPGQRGQRPCGAPGRTDPGAVAAMLAACAPPALGVPRSAPADAAPGDSPPNDLEARGPPAWPRQRRLGSSAPTLLGHPALSAGRVVAHHPRTPWPPASHYHGALHASDAPHLRRGTRHQQRSRGRPLTALGHGDAGGGGRLPVLWSRRSGAVGRGSPAQPSPRHGGY